MAVTCRKLQQVVKRDSWQHDDACTKITFKAVFLGFVLFFFLNSALLRYCMGTLKITKSRGMKSCLSLVVLFYGTLVT